MPSSPSVPPSIERNMAAHALVPSPHKRLLDFFRSALDAFQSSPASFRVVCTLGPRARDGPAALLQHRILATPQPQQPPPGGAAARLVVLDSSFNPPSAAHLRMAREAVVAELVRTKAWARQREEEEEGGGAGDGGGGGGGGGVRLLLLLAVRNADKAAKPAAFEQRLAMMWAFARDVRRALEEGEETEEEEGNKRSTGAGVAVDVALSTEPYFHAKSAAIAESDFYSGLERDGSKAQRDGGTAPEQVILAGYDTLIRIFDPKYYGPPSGIAEVSSAGETPIRRALDPFFRRARLRVTMRTDDEWGGEDEQRAYVERLVHGDEPEKIGGSREWAKRIELVDGRKEGEPAVSSTLAREAAKAQDWDRLVRLVPPEVKKWIEREKLYADA